MINFTALRHELRTKEASPLLSRVQMPQETHDRAERVFSAAVAEAGYPYDAEWDEDRHSYWRPGVLPLEILNRARIITFEALGLEWELSEPTGPYRDDPTFTTWPDGPPTNERGK